MLKKKKISEKIKFSPLQNINTILGTKRTNRQKMYFHNSSMLTWESDLTIWFFVCSWCQPNKISLNLYFQQMYLLKQANYNVFLLDLIKLAHFFHVLLYTIDHSSMVKSVEVDCDTLTIFLSFIVKISFPYLMGSINHSIRNIRTSLFTHIHSFK